MILYRSSMPQIDLHGEDRIGAIIKIKSFIEENIKLRNNEIAIIHGIGQGILRNEIWDYLKKDKRIEEYSLDMFNEGCTLVRLNIVDN